MSSILLSPLPEGAPPPGGSGPGFWTGELLYASVASSGFALNTTVSLVLSFTHSRGSHWGWSGIPVWVRVYTTCAQDQLLYCVAGEYVFICMGVA